MIYIMHTDKAVVDVGREVLHFINKANSAQLCDSIYISHRQISEGLVLDFLPISTRLKKCIPD